MDIYIWNKSNHPYRELSIQSFSLLIQKHKVFDYMGFPANKFEYNSFVDMPYQMMDQMYQLTAKWLRQKSTTNKCDW